MATLDGEDEIPRLEDGEGHTPKARIGEIFASMKKKKINSNLRRWAFTNHSRCTDEPPNN